MKYETAGDPMTDLKWTRKTAKKIAEELRKSNIKVSASTVYRILKTMKYSLRSNHKTLSFGSGPDRNEQMLYIRKERKSKSRKGIPIVSVDTKKKEMVGNFKNNGTAWGREPIRVKDHDFRSQADGIAIPYGIYDVEKNEGSVFIGSSHDTPEFAVDCIAKWWTYTGCHCYPGAKELLIIADGGGSNGHRSRVWKHAVQERLCNRYGIQVTVCHLPTGASKWNPIEHQFFSEISKNWAGRPLDSYQTILNYARSTTTVTGLKVKSYLVPKHYPTGVKISDQAMDEICLKRHKTQPKRNYTISPR